MSADDAALARRLRAREPRAFDELLDRHGAALLGYLRGLVRERSTAEDLLQETLLRVHRGIEGYRERGTFRAWLYRIATNLALSELRRRRDAPLDEAALAVVDPHAADPERALERAQRDAQLHAALATLPADQRVVLLLRARELGVREIAEALCVPEGTIKSRVHYAVRGLRERLARHAQTCPEEHP